MSSEIECSKCLVIKPWNEFWRPDGASPECILCKRSSKREYQRKWQQKNRKKTAEYNRKYYAQNPHIRRAQRQRDRERKKLRVLGVVKGSVQIETFKNFNARLYVYSVKRNSICVDCKNKYHPVAMDFDHLPKFKKTYQISDMVVRGGFSKEQIDAEIAKCELVCANCHRIRTFERKYGNLKDENFN